MQSRYYSPFLKRFISLDDTGILEATKGEILGANLYAYCNNNPTMNEDPSGYVVISTFWASLIIDAVLTFAVPFLASTYDILGYGLKVAFKKFGYKSVADKLLYSVVPRIRGMLGKFLTGIRKAIWRLTGLALSNLSTNFLNRALNRITGFLYGKKGKALYNFISMFFSIGSMVAGLLDLATDGNLNGKIRIGR